MGLFFKIGVVLLLLLLFTHCSRKKSAAPNLQDWLDGHFSSRFQVLSTQGDDVIRNLSFKVKKSVVAEAADTMVQSLVRWDARQPDLKLTAAGVAAQFERAAKEWEAAKAFHKTLKMNGFEDISVSVRSGKATVLVFEEPLSERRIERVYQLEKALAEWPVSNNYNKELAFMGMSAGEKEFGDFVPLAYWEQADVPYQKQMLFSISCRYDHPFSAAELERSWKFNTDSERFSVFYKKVREELEKWSAQHFNNKLVPVFDLVEVGQSGPSPMLLKFKIPYTERLSESSDSAQPSVGHFIIDFDIDRQVVKEIRQLDGVPEEE